MNKLLIPCIYLRDGRAAAGFSGTGEAWDGDPEALAAFYGNSGADELLVFDLSCGGDQAHEEAVAAVKRICLSAQVPVLGAGGIQRMEDVKKLIYAGCAGAVLNFAKESNQKLLPEVSGKFGRDKIIVRVPDVKTWESSREEILRYADRILCSSQVAAQAAKEEGVRTIVYSDTADAAELLARPGTDMVTGPCVSGERQDLMAVKSAARARGIPVNTFESAVRWEDFKLNADGMIPVVVQDCRTDEVLMLAYMNEEAFQTTLATGRMTYWSRSRNELWTKGMTSGHFQYVKELLLDCDGDTILAKVAQVGPACHTGSRSCFFRKLAGKEYDSSNPLKVFEEVYGVIADRKQHPKEGSYTNYLFDKGIDKILKKVGEECTEIVIAAKNPDKEEIKYEISDFLYHVMVLMVEKGVAWEEITAELARR